MGAKARRARTTTPSIHAVCHTLCLVQCGQSQKEQKGERRKDVVANVFGGGRSPFLFPPLLLSSHLLKVEVAGVAGALKAFELKGGRQLVLVVAARIAEDAAAHAAVVLATGHGKLAGAVDTVLCVLVVLPHGRHGSDAIVELCHLNRKERRGGKVCGSLEGGP